MKKRNLKLNHHRQAARSMFKAREIHQKVEILREFRAKLTEKDRAEDLKDPDAVVEEHALWLSDTSVWLKAKKLLNPVCKQVYGIKMDRFIKLATYEELLELTHHAIHTYELKRNLYHDASLDYFDPHK